MAINRLTPASTSTEGIVTIKIAQEVSEKTVPTSFPAGNYRIDTGASGLIKVALLKSDGSLELEFSFTTSSFFTIANTVTKVQIVATTASVNGIVTFQQLSRGVVSTNIWSYSTPGGDLQRGCKAVNNAANTAIYFVGGTNDTDWSVQSGAGIVRKWVKSTNTWSTVVTGNTNINYQVHGVAVNNVMYFCNTTNTSNWYKFDTATETVTTLSAPSYPIRIGTAVKNNQNTKIYALGSYQNATPMSFRVYTIATNTWANLTTAPFGSGGYGGANSWAHPSDNDKLYWSDTQAQTTIYRYNITADTWTDTGISVINVDYTSGTERTNYNGLGSLTPSGNYFIYSYDSNRSASATTIPSATDWCYNNSIPTVRPVALTGIYSQPATGSRDSWHQSMVHFDDTNIYVFGGMSTLNPGGIWYVPYATFLSRVGLS